MRIGILLLAIWVLHRELAGFDMADLTQHLRSYGWQRVTLGIAATAGSFASLGVIEVLAIFHDELASKIPARVAMLTGFVANALSQSIGVALLTGTAIRLRTYRPRAVHASAIARVSAFVTLTTVLGLCATAAIAFLATPEPLRLHNVSVSLRPIGAAFMLAVAAYLAWSMLPGGAVIGRGAWAFRRPASKVALAQVTVASLDWVLTGSVLYLMLPTTLGVGYGAALRVYLVAQTVGTLSHVPGGAGVFELLVLVLLSPIAGPAPAVRAALLAALVMFRVLYYFLPLMAACIVSAIAEARGFTLRRPTSPVLDA